ncbi:MAG: response regulator transcription factor [Bacteroidetes bacterium]|nr:response regulator transcription factor [Bacteroidota bacterium]MBU1116252.1 response regulator transcription factor [Bacteroidota bacterium]MBU1799750.1 response regulator transcription factor [Bacteroidota bacterium]
MKILIVEDEKKIAESLRKNFNDEGFETIVCFDGSEALETISKEKFDLILLDWRLPEITGIEVCKRIRNANNRTPVILLTALSNISNKVEALNCGADDYITKPFSFEEVLARVNAIIRRYKFLNNIIEFENMSLNLITHTLETKTESIKLPEMEFELLKYFLENKDRIVSREILCEEVWKLKYTPTTNVVEVTVKNLRKKLEEYSDNKFIKSVYGEGYLFISN